MESKAKTTVTFHSGILTIGGTIIEVAYKDAHIFFDFGTEYRPELGLQDESLATLLKNRLVPELKGLYDERLGYTYQGNDEKEYRHTAVFLSHAHLDHSKMINYLDPKIPLYTMKETKAILHSLNRNGDFLIASPFEKSGFTREMTGLNAHDVVQVGEISVEIVPVDHDAYGAAALLIRTPDHFLVYTGDLRLHGYDRANTEAFCQQAKHTDLLMMEGVSISFPEREPDPSQITVSSEEELIQEFVRLMEENLNRQITFNGYPANVLRFAKLIEYSPRTVVLEATMAALLKEVSDINVCYYYAEENNKIQALDPALELSYEVLLNDQTEYIWQVVNKIENLQGGGLYVHSDAQPLGDFDPQYAIFLNLLKDLQVEFVRLSLSGHAHPDDLKEIIRMIEPKLLVPIHTLKPEKLENPYGERILPNRGDNIIL
ncbi:MBL fold metallo-hydrolase [Carnobacterium mobile]|uniref:MBL fold metallo-hydrolase n=1 Tax=Carnobacterium mobile TaxID=2750 RepID=UPI000557D2A6|nr:MBL fold metallo-hydrolase [Carnobacterium mobile]